MKYLFKSLILIIILAGTHGLKGQNINRETGLRLTASGGSDFVFKKEKDSGRFKRLRVGLTNLGYSGTNDEFRLGFVFALGLEKRKKIKDQLYFIHGFEPGIRISSLDGNSDLQVGLGYVLGFQYDIAPNFSALAEAIPFVGSGIDGGQDSFLIDLGINSSASIGFVYRFRKSKK